MFSLQKSLGGALLAIVLFCFATWGREVGLSGLRQTLASQSDAIASQSDAIASQSDAIASLEERHGKAIASLKERIDTLLTDDCGDELDPSSQRCVSVQLVRRASEAIAPERRMFGMFPSEARAVIEASLVQEIDLLVESGTANGVSTELFARSMPTLKIETIDLDAYGLHEKTKAALHACCPNVETFVGDSRKRLLHLGQENPEARIGVVIDGPKGAQAFRLAEQLFAAVPNLRFIAIHDTAPFWEDYKQDYPTAATLDGAEASSVVRTWAARHRAEFGSLDSEAIAAFEAMLDTKTAERIELFRKFGAGLDLFLRSM